MHLAEQATLGALMLEPQLAADVTTWLRAEDFDHPWHRSVYASIRELHAAHAPVDPQRVGVAMVDRLGRRADLPHLLDLLQAAPTRPVGHRYAAMVLEASLRRDTACQGVLLQAAALSAGLAQHSRPVTTVVAQVDASLDHAEHRWRHATSDPVAPRTEVETLGLGIPVSALGADRLLQAHPALDPAAVRRGEEALVASLIARPDHVGDVVRWLRPDALTSTAWRPVYAAVIQLAELGEPVDVVTVAWEVHRASSRLGPGPGTRELRDAVESAACTYPSHLARAVAADHVRITADRAAHALRAAAGNPGVDLTDVLATGHLLTSALRESAEALPASPRGEVPDLGLVDYDFGPDRVPHAAQGHAHELGLVSR
jgi:replicative DNA helicase